MYACEKQEHPASLFINPFKNIVLNEVYVSHYV